MRKKDDMDVKFFEVEQLVYEEQVQDDGSRRARVRRLGGLALLRKAEFLYSPLFVLWLRVAVQ